ncbi:MAG: hypothetical protein IKS51_06690 [Erysipelotrichaceae bacterium]|nr:hypothetical protein [Erysipelotrichaceae bacterium]
MNIYYQFQHRVLPNWAYRSEHFLNDLINVGVQEVLYNAIRNVYADQKEELPYTKEDFSGFYAWLDDETIVITLRFPKPEEVPLCYSAYIIKNVKTGQMMYYTLEKGQDPINGKEMQFLCSWNSEGKHQQHASAYTEKTHLGDLVLIRFFYTQFRNLQGFKLPEQFLEEGTGRNVIACPACQNGIVYDPSGIAEGEDFLLMCPRCGRIHALKGER